MFMYICYICDIILQKQDIPKPQSPPSPSAEVDTAASRLRDVSPEAAISWEMFRPPGKNFGENMEKYL